ncbi:MAG: tryptophan synthase subunit alpha [Dehalococcoidia bacterium]
MSRIEAKFAQLKRAGKTGLALFLTVGYPDKEAVTSLVPALVAGGADIIELGVPFSDPLADGATIQQASHEALRQGVTLRDCIDACRRLRQRSVEVPIVLMGYYNPILTYGLERFAEEGAEAGLDGVIVADLPPEEASPLRKACLSRGLDLIFLLAPTSTDERIRKVCRQATGFIYCVSLTGVTGARKELPVGLPNLIARVRKESSLPLAVGFGVSTRAHVETIGSYADAAVVGSALIDLIRSSPVEERASRARVFVEKLAGKNSPSLEGAIGRVV